MSPLASHLLSSKGGVKNCFLWAFKCVVAS
jgi:hypothetical protein